MSMGGLMLTLEIDEREADAEDGMLFPAIFSTPIATIATRSSPSS